MFKGILHFTRFSNTGSMNAWSTMTTKVYKRIIIYVTRTKYPFSYVFYIAESENDNEKTVSREVLLLELLRKFFLRRLQLSGANPEVLNFLLVTY